MEKDNKERKVIIIEPKIVPKALEKEPATKIRVAAYARVSTEQDEQQSSYEAQVNYYTNFIQSNPNWEFVGVFSDEGISGTSTKHREGFNRMIDTAMQGNIDVILTKSISRFARNTVDTLQTIRKLKKVGVEVRFEKEGLGSLDPKCEMILTVFSSLAQEESRSISENVRWGIRHRMQMGQVSLPYSSFLGYRKGENGRPEIVEEEAEIVRRIYQMFLDNYSIREIAETLTKDGIPTPRHKTVWSATTVERILRNEKYRGEALLQKTYVVDFLTKEQCKNNGEVQQYRVENSHPAIIDPEIHKQVQKKLDEMRRGRRSRSPLAKKIICGECGGYYGHKVWKSRGKIRYDVWVCGHKQNGCQMPSIREDTIKQLFMELMVKKGVTKDTADYSDELWGEQVENVTIYRDRIEYRFNDGTCENVDYDCTFNR